MSALLGIVTENCQQFICYYSLISFLLDPYISSFVLNDCKLSKVIIYYFEEIVNDIVIM